MRDLSSARTYVAEKIDSRNDGASPYPHGEAKSRHQYQPAGHNPQTPLIPSAHDRSRRTERRERVGTTYVRLMLPLVTLIAAAGCAPWINGDVTERTERDQIRFECTHIALRACDRSIMGLECRNARRLRCMDNAMRQTRGRS